MITRAQARAVRIVGLDVDGTLTDGGIYLGAVSGDEPVHSTRLAGSHVEFKRYDIQDGLGVHLLRAAGIKVVIVTGRTSHSVQLRATELNVDAVAQDPDARKYPLWNGFLTQFGLGARDAAFVGDDLPDLAIMREVGLAVAVSNAVPEIRAVAHHTLRRSGGRGAVREFAEVLLKARGEWNALVEAYVLERTGGGARPDTAARVKPRGRRARSGRTP